ncbi:MAG: DUF1330 domain-containing protein [Pseudooceanicola sp.]
MSEDLIDRLVATHGEDGAVPSRAEWARILALPGDRPLLILNLLAFAPETGQQAYGAYLQGVAPAFAAAGGEQVFFGPAAFCFGMGDEGDWDAAILTRYPSPLALANMWLDPGYIEAHQAREDGLTRSQVLVIEADKARLPEGAA